MLLGSVSSQQRFGVMDVKALGVSQLSGLIQTVLQLSDIKQTVLQLLDKSVLQLHVTVLFYLENSRKIHLRGPAQGVGGVGAWRERALALWLLFLYVFFLFLPLSLPYVNWASQECCLFYLRSSLQSWTFLCSIFTGFSFPYLLATTILDSFSLF